MLHTRMTIETSSGMPTVLRKWLSPHACLVLSGVRGEWEELHLRVGRACSVTVGGENRRVDLTWSREDMDALVVRLCDGSLYAHRESINLGYIAPGDGIRVGICGRAFFEMQESGTQLLGVRNIDALCFRFPRPLRSVGRCLAARLRTDFPAGALIYAPPGVGKTTLLRALAEQFSRGEYALRVAVVDSRCELDDGGFSDEALLTFLSGYPKGQGIEIAARSMSAQLILCDEIGNADEARAVLAAANCGVPVIATAHARSVKQLLCRPGFDLLHRAAVFGSYVGIARIAGERDYRYHITAWEDACHVD